MLLSYLEFCDNQNTESNTYWGVSIYVCAFHIRCLICEKFGIRDLQMLYTREFRGSCVGENSTFVVCVSMKLHLRIYIENIWLLKTKFL